jgi:hypothetical protein
MRNAANKTMKFITDSLLLRIRVYKGQCFQRPIEITTFHTQNEKKMFTVLGTLRNQNSYYNNPQKLKQNCFALKLS